MFEMSSGWQQAAEVVVAEVVGAEGDLSSHGGSVSAPYARSAVDGLRWQLLPLQRPFDLAIQMRGHI